MTLAHTVRGRDVSRTGGIMGREEVEKHWQATYDLTEVGIAWFIEHRDTLEEDAANGCERSAQIIAALDLFFETGEAMYKDEDDKEFEAIIAASYGD
jgi:hypothetical protein